MVPFFGLTVVIRWRLMYCCYEWSSVVEVRTANGGFYPHRVGLGLSSVARMRRKSDININAVRYRPRKREDITSLNPIVRKLQYNQHAVTLEAGVMTRQATAAIMVGIDDATMLATIVD